MNLGGELKQYIDNENYDDACLLIKEGEITSLEITEFLQKNYLSFDKIRAFVSAMENHNDIKVKEKVEFVCNDIITCCDLTENKTIGLKDFVRCSKIGLSELVEKPNAKQLKNWIFIMLTRFNDLECGLDKVLENGYSQNDQNIVKVILDCFKIKPELEDTFMYDFYHMIKGKTQNDQSRIIDFYRDAIVKNGFFSDGAVCYGVSWKFIELAYGISDSDSAEYCDLKLFVESSILDDANKETNSYFNKLKKVYLMFLQKKTLKDFKDYFNVDDKDNQDDDSTESSFVEASQPEAKFESKKSDFVSYDSGKEQESYKIKCEELAKQYEQCKQLEHEIERLKCVISKFDRQIEEIKSLYNEKHAEQVSLILESLYKSKSANTVKMNECREEFEEEFTKFLVGAQLTPAETFSFRKKILQDYDKEVSEVLDDALCNKLRSMMKDENIDIIGVDTDVESNA